MRACALVLAIAATLVAGPVCAQTAEPWPAKSITIIVPFPAGGTTDIVARAMQQFMQKEFGKPVVIENIAGAGGNIGAAKAAQAEPGGYTLLMGTVGTHAINKWLYKRMAFDPVNDFKPVTLAARVPNVVVVHPSVPARSIAELVALAKSKPGEINYASSGIGTSIHLSGVLFEQMAGVSMKHITYRGSAPAVNDLIAGHVQVMFDNLPSAMPQIQGGTLRALAVTTLKRSPALPDLPTVDEAGLKGFETSSWFGLFAPAKTPDGVVQRLHEVTVRALADPDIRRTLEAQGAEPAGIGLGEFAAFVQAELAKWREVVSRSGASID